MPAMSAASLLSLLMLRLAVGSVVICLSLSALMLALGSGLLPSRVLVYATAQYPEYILHTVDIDHGLSLVTASNFIADWFSMDCSPDGTQLVFPARPAGRATSADLYLTHAISGQLHQLTQHPDADVSPRWSPDGTHIAYVKFHRSGAGAIFVMNGDGTSVERVAGGAVVDQMPAWSPDGTQIAFMETGPGRPEIAVITLGGGWQQLTDNDVYDGMPVWSPDGTRIAFMSFREENYDIYLMDTHGRNVQRLTTSPAFDTNPAWSPDGTQIAFVSSRGVARELYLMDADGGNQRPLAESLAVSSPPVWSRDGELLAVLSKTDGDKEIYLVRADGSGYWRLTHNEQDDFLPAWCG
jgi:Tol biopolymer transport system component